MSAAPQPNVIGASGRAYAEAQHGMPPGASIRPEGPMPATGDSPLQTLLAIEADVRRAATISELAHLMANETRKLIGVRQVFVLQKVDRTSFRALAISSLASVDQTAPLVRWMLERAAELARSKRLNDVVELRISASGGNASDVRDFPFDHLLFAPLKLRDGSIFGALALARESDWDEHDKIVLRRLCETFEHAFRALTGEGKLRRSLHLRRRLGLAGVLLTLLVLTLPVSMTALAPFEIVAGTPIVVAAPIDGVITRVVVEPNATVQANDVLFKFEDTVLSSKFDVAERNVAVNLAKQRKLAQSAFVDAASRRELAIAETELKLSETERDYALNLLEKSVVRAAKAGVVSFGARKDWEGRPVATGERIMEIVDPNVVAISIELPVKDAIVIRNDARIKLYLDSDPLNPREAQLSQASYHAQPTTANTLAFMLRAQAPGTAPGVLRLGHRGTAQIYGDKTWLGFYLFRRPIAALRQLVGL